jgi:hypothetical protein
LVIELFVHFERWPTGSWIKRWFKSSTSFSKKCSLCFGLSGRLFDIDDLCHTPRFWTTYRTFDCLPWRGSVTKRIWKGQSISYVSTRLKVHPRSENVMTFIPLHLSSMQFRLTMRKFTDIFLLLEQKQFSFPIFMILTRPDLIEVIYGSLKPWNAPGQFEPRESRDCPGFGTICSNGRF